MSETITPADRATVTTQINSAAQRPGLSNAALARGVFVSRQATHQLLSGLKGSGLVDVHGAGRDQRLALTAHGSTLLAAASKAVAEIEERTAALHPYRQGV